MAADTDTSTVVDDALAEIRQELDQSERTLEATPASDPSAAVFESGRRRGLEAALNALTTHTDSEPDATLVQEAGER